MTTGTVSEYIPGTGFKTDGDMGRLWLALMDQRKHKKKRVLAQLKSEDPEDRLKWFKFNGRFPRDGMKYRYVVHDELGELCMEVHEIKDISD